MRRALLIVVLAAMLMLAGCGGETGGDDEPSAPEEADDLEGSQAAADDGDDETEEATGENEGDDDGDPEQADDGDPEETAEDSDSEEAGDDDSTDDGAGDADTDESDESDDEGSSESDDEGPSEGDDEGSSEGDGSTDEETNDEDADAQTAAVDGELEIHHIDVGQADATLLIAPSGETMLIDTGDWRQDGSGVIDYLEARGVDRIDHLVATHAHADHIGGHAAVIEHYEADRGGIGAAYDSGIAHNSATYENYLDAVEYHDVTLYEVQEGDSLEFGDAHVEFYNPPAGDSGTGLHYNSVALTVEFGEVTYLTTGDAEDDAEARLVETYGSELDADVYQAGHHGSSTSSTDPFLDAVSPDTTVISSAHDSQYGHPHDEVLESFGDRGIETYWTGVHGDVIVTTDGETVSVEPTGEAPTDGHELIGEKPDDEEAAALAHPSVDMAGTPLTAR